MNQSNNKDTLATMHFMLENKATADVFEPARKSIYKLGIKTSYDKTRMIFSTLHTHKNNLCNIYTQECNGLILEMGTWKPLMVPPRSLRFNIETDISNKFLHQGLYHIYKVLDGTCFNLYYFNDKWVISTAKGYEMNDMKWEKNTYQELITDCLSKLSVPMTWEEFTAGLVKTKCYSLGFKHPNFHRFSENNNSVYKLWFIQSVDLDENSSQYLWSSDKSPFENIKSQEFYDKPVGNLKELYHVATNALNNYINTRDVNTKDICYGFILRSVNYEITGYHSDLFIESSLMRTIRKIWYENTIIDLCHSNKWNKETAITLNMYLDSNMRDTFINLFPQYSDLFSKYTSTIKDIIECMIYKADHQEDSKDNIDTLLQVAKNLLHEFKINNKCDVGTKTNEQKRRIYTEYVSHSNNLCTVMLMLLSE